MSTLIIVNVVVWVANIVLSQAQRFTPGFQGVVNEFLLLSSEDRLSPLYWWRTITYGFAHDAVSPFHLLFNMLGLYFLGRAVEERYGRNEFLRIYFFALFVCGASWLLKQYALGADDNRMLGASGAVLCIEMLFVFNFPTQRIFLFVFPVPAWVLGIILVLTNFVSTPSTGIAYDVHMVGILVAAAYFFLGLSFRSLDDLRSAWRRSWRRLTGPKLKVHSDFQESKQRDSEEADRILAKIHEKGQDSLTSRERKFLERYSREVRAKQKLD
ncbi:MAG: rhomboid family intramembrane serine protease [Pirellula sp.]